MRYDGLGLGIRDVMMPQPDYIACSGITPEVRTEKTAPKSSLMMIVFAESAMLSYAREEEEAKSARLLRVLLS